MKHFLLTFVALCVALNLSAETINYTGSNDLFPNPERGIITMLEMHTKDGDKYCAKGHESTLDAYIAQDDMTLVLLHYYLDKYTKTETLPNELLEAFNEDMKVLRNKGLKAIIRFSYVADNKKDAKLDIVKKHISQYKDYWQANADVIFVFQAGLIGQWGEWYYTENYGDNGEWTEARREVIDALLDAVPEDRCIQLRTPRFKKLYLGDSNPLTAEEAYTKTPCARLGHHNDAFLASSTDYGTYEDPATDKAYIAQETLYVPLGGESCIEDDNVADQNASYAKTTEAMYSLHWTFIQGGYSKVVTDKWRTNGTMDELKKYLGYRFQLISSVIDDEVEQGHALPVKIEISNIGYAPLYNERPAYLVLRNGNAVYPLRLESDLRTWRPGGINKFINENVTIPEDLPAGEYELLLHLPDAYANLSDDSRYAIRFANINTWEPATGFNKLNATVTVKPQQTPPEPPEPPQPSDAILLPATLNKANVTDFSTDMTWYDTDYFDFGSADAPNLDRWADWKVELKYLGKYSISDVATGPDGSAGHQWKLQLRDGSTVIAECTTEQTWDIGEFNYETKIDLSAVDPGTYTLRVTNAFSYAQPKLQSITLTYDGEIPTDNSRDAIISVSTSDQPVDILGRPVGEDYRGIVITNGKKILR